ncbi:MAG TPA: FtsW/RodA/SpoVE family cell cycle protein [Bacteroidales bacterium]|nr:FtsW/RodA/SpoVE family cell cycle protein [Bacteroidales bacterium]
MLSRLQNIKGDKVVWMVVILLSGLSLLAVYSSSSSLAYRTQAGNTGHYLIKHAMILVFGLFLMHATHRIPYQVFSRASVIGMFLTLPLLAITLFMGTSVNEASRWLMVPFINISFQTSDLAKLVLIVFTARALAKRQDSIRDLRSGFFPVFLPVLAVSFLILPANFSTAALLMLTCVVLMYIGKVRVKHLLALGGIVLASLSLFVLILLNSSDKGRLGTWKSRVESFAGGDEQEAFQVEQGKIAIATGGVLGKAPGNSSQRNFLPHPYSDFIFAIIVEEYGLLGGIAVVLLYLILLYRGIRITLKSPTLFGGFMAFGLTFSIVFQAFVNMAVAVDLLPVTGQPLPLVSMGGTSILFTSIALGAILSVSRQEEIKTSPAHAAAA